MIDPAHHQIGFTILQYIVFGKFDTIGRCTAGLVCQYIFKNILFIQPQGLSNGNGMTHSRLGTIGGDHHHVAQFFHDGYQYANSFGGDAVVVRDENQGSGHD